MALFSRGETPTLVEVGDKENAALERLGYKNTLGVPRSSEEHSELDAATLLIIRVHRPSHLDVR